MTPTLNPFGNEEEGNEKKQNILFICAMLPGYGWSNGGIMSNEEKMGVIDMSSPPWNDAFESLAQELI